jgi:hypothetical protein
MKLSLPSSLGKCGIEFANFATMSLSGMFHAPFTLPSLTLFPSLTYFEFCLHKHVSGEI